MVDEAWKNMYLPPDKVAPSRKPPRQTHKLEGAFPRERPDTGCVSILEKGTAL